MNAEERQQLEQLGWNTTNHKACRFPIPGNINMFVTVEDDVEFDAVAMDGGSGYLHVFGVVLVAVGDGGDEWKVVRTPDAGESA